MSIILLLPKFRSNFDIMPAYRDVPENTRRSRRLSCQEPKCYDGESCPLFEWICISQSFMQMMALRSSMAPKHRSDSLPSPYLPSPSPCLLILLLRNLLLLHLRSHFYLLHHLLHLLLLDLLVVMNLTAPRTRNEKARITFRVLRIRSCVSDPNSG